MNNKPNLKLFDELCVSENIISKIIDNYVFPEKYYKEQLKEININWPKDKKEQNKIIQKNEKNIKFRTKNIIFLGYSKEKYNDFYFLLTTTSNYKENKNGKMIRQSLLYIKKEERINVYINLDKIYYLNFNDHKFWSSYSNKNKSNIIQNRKWKRNFLKEINNKLLKDLCKNTSLDIYKKILEERKKNL